MKYLSTRNKQKTFDFAQVTLMGLAPDGGLFVPAELPNFEHFLTQELNYSSLAERVFQPFVTPVLNSSDLYSLVANAYQVFDCDNVVNLARYGEHWVLELFHGPTLAFKDIALQFLGRVLGHLLVDHQSVTVIGATSGDTGGSAIAALTGLPNCQVFMLYPFGRVSEVQALQMTRGVGDNVFPIAIDGSFDDAQALVKQAFSDPLINRRLNLTTVNSINWCRIMAQMVYYFYTVIGLKQTNASQLPISFAVPTGNFGDVLAGYYAMRCGLPVARLIVACNENDLLARTYHTGVYQPRESRQTLSPAMDIQIASNFERLLFELSGRDDEYVTYKMRQLKDDGKFTLEENILREFRNLFDVYRISDEQTKHKMKQLAEMNQLVDPHTAVGLCAAERYISSHHIPTETVITLATAHPVKFANTCLEVIGKAPDWPEKLKALNTMPERVFHSSNDYSDIQSLILSRSHL
jgi:threonine synthase